MYRFPLNPLSRVELYMCRERLCKASQSEATGVRKLTGAPIGHATLEDTEVPAQPKWADIQLKHPKDQMLEVRDIN